MPGGDDEARKRVLRSSSGRFENAVARKGTSTAFEIRLGSLRICEDGKRRRLAGEERSGEQTGVFGGNRVAMPVLRYCYTWILPCQG